MTIRDTLRQAAGRISEAGSDEATLEAEILLMHATGLDRARTNVDGDIVAEAKPTARAIMEVQARKMKDAQD